MSRYATTPCNQCGAPIVFATARQPDGTARPVPMDPSVPVYLEPEVLAALLAWLKRIGAVRS